MLFRICIARSQSGTLKEIEQGYQVKIAVDQSMKSAGYSTVKVSGAADAVQQAAEHMNQSLARTAAVPGDAGQTGPFLLDSPPAQSLDRIWT